MNRKIITVHPYNPAWPQMFEAEASQIKQALGAHCLRIEHFGSTSVPELSAKEDLDIMCVVDELQASLELQSIGFTFKGEWNIPLRYGFSKNTDQSKVNLHVVEADHGFIELNLCVRDFLRTNADTRQAYQALKENLVNDPSIGDRTPSGFARYTLDKDAFIKSLLEQAGYKGLMVNFCVHDREWQTARAFRQRNFFDKVSIQDPYTWTFEHPDHAHLVLYQSTQIVGYAHIQLWPDQRAALRIIVIDESFRQQGLGAYFLRFCERWLKQKGFKALVTQSSPTAEAFYRTLRYHDMPFNDPDDHGSDPQDVDLGKIL
jgi:GrpB-like predicted nucleotidyltransferase (UPF0157 family)/GNAT superfamily N-acetyltransferase